MEHATTQDTDFRIVIYTVDKFAGISAPHTWQSCHASGLESGFIRENKLLSDNLYSLVAGPEQRRQNEAYHFVFFLNLLEELQFVREQT
jgi:hypothetical protein